MVVKKKLFKKKHCLYTEKKLISLKNLYSEIDGAFYK